MQPVVDYPSGQHLWACPNDTSAIDEAKTWIKLEGYDATTVKLVKAGNMVLVVMK